MELKRLSHQLLSVTQADIGKRDSAVNAQIDKMQALIDANILVFVDSLSSALKASPATPSASSADLDSQWAQRSGPVSSRGALSGEAGITRDRSFSSPPTLTESTGAEREKQEKMRMNVINEILSTETVYCTQLKMVLADVRSSFLARTHTTARTTPPHGHEPCLRVEYGLCVCDSS